VLEMTDKCVMCGKFLSEDWRNEDDLSSGHCGRCIEILGAETEEAEIGIGTGSCISGKFGTAEYCRHVVKRSTNVPMGKLRLLV
jgi:hypothetical protein